MGTQIEDEDLMDLSPRRGLRKRQRLCGRELEVRMDPSPRQKDAGDSGFQKRAPVRQPEPISGKPAPLSGVSKANRPRTLGKYGA